MRGINKVIIVGKLGNDPDYKQFSNGGALANISVATSESWNDRQTGERRELTEWHRVVLENRGNYRLADIAQQYLRKGSTVYIEGSLRTRKWTDNNGVERYTTEIRADNMQMLDSRSAGDNQGYGNGNAYGNQNPYGNPANPNMQASQNNGFAPNQSNPNNFGQAAVAQPQTPQQNQFAASSQPAPNAAQPNFANAVPSQQPETSIQDDDMPF